jgi:hypothetical protein
VPRCLATSMSIRMASISMLHCFNAFAKSNSRACVTFIPRHFMNRHQVHTLSWLPDSCECRQVSYGQTLTAGFVAPEVIDGDAHSPALDMFAMGVMLYITITGRRPMTNRQANTLTYNSFEAWDYPHMHVCSTSSCIATQLPLSARHISLRDCWKWGSCVHFPDVHDVISNVRVCAVLRLYPWISLMGGFELKVATNTTAKSTTHTSAEM